MRAFGKERTMANGQRLVDDTGINFHTLETSFCIHPCETLPSGRRPRKTRIVENRLTIPIAGDHGFDMKKPAAGIDGENQFTSKWSDAHVSQGNAGAMPFARNTSASHVKAPDVRLIGSAGRLIKERVEDAHLGRAPWWS